MIFDMIFSLILFKLKYTFNGVDKALRTDISWE